jgi:hypothetical protein
MLIIRVPWNVAAIPLPDGRRCMSVTLKLSFANIAVPLFFHPDIYMLCISPYRVHI